MPPGLVTDAILWDLFKPGKKVSDDMPLAKINDPSIEMKSTVRNFFIKEFLSTHKMRLPRKQAH